MFAAWPRWLTEDGRQKGPKMKTSNRRNFDFAGFSIPHAGQSIPDILYSARHGHDKEPTVLRSVAAACRQSAVGS